MSSSIAVNKRGREESETLSDATTNDLKRTNAGEGGDAGAGGSRRKRRGPIITPVCQFNWDDVTFEKTVRKDTFKKVPLTMKIPGGDIQRGPLVQFENLKMPYQPKIQVTKNGTSLELTVSAGDDPACVKFCAEGNAVVLNNAKKNKDAYFKKDDRDDAAIEKGHRTLDEVKYKKYEKNEHGEWEPVGEEKWPNIMKFSIPLDKNNEPAINIKDAHTGESLTLEDMQGGSFVDVVGKLNCQWFGAGKFGVKPTAVCINVHPRESYHDIEALPSASMARARKGLDIYDKDGQPIAPEEEDDIEDEDFSSDVNGEAQIDFNSFGVRT